MRNISITCRYKPNSRKLSEISKVCSMVCSRINNKYNIILRPVQLLVILRLADEILNNSKSHGSISEIKKGEGKSLNIHDFDDNFSFIQQKS